MNIKLKLNRREMDLLIEFIENTYPDRPKTNYERLLAFCLADLLQKLQVANIIIKDQYQISISAALGFGFVEHSLQWSDLEEPLMAITVNKVVGIIDQKAALITQ
jgi:hypothetical protein